MSEQQTPSEQGAPSKGALRQEADSAVAGPGFVATKSQTQGLMIGTVIGTVIGVVLGVVVAFVFFGDRTSTVVITVIAFAIAGATAGGTSGGFVRNRERQQRGDPDV
jgi:hypothetical protein